MPLAELVCGIASNDSCHIERWARVTLHLVKGAQGSLLLFFPSVLLYLSNAHRRLDKALSLWLAPILSYWEEPVLLNTEFVLGQCEWQLAPLLWWCQNEGCVVDSRWWEAGFWHPVRPLLRFLRRPVLVLLLEFGCGGGEHSHFRNLILHFLQGRCLGTVSSWALHVVARGQFLGLLHSAAENKENINYLPLINNK